MSGRFDLVVHDVTLHDGTGAEGRTASLAVANGRIARIDDTITAPAEREIDGTGLALSPGFIDVHTHDDRAILATDMAAKLTQGVTCVVVGNCGISLAPLPGSGGVVPPLDLIARGPGDLFARYADYLSAVADAGPVVNMVGLVGHSTLRLATMDRLDRAAMGPEARAMRDLLDRALDDGAIGLSTGLYYEPANAASTVEILQVAEPLARFNGVYTTHLRDEADGVLDAMEEAFEIGRGADVPVVLSHHKVTDARNRGRTAETLPVIAARAAEQPVTLDVYPYNASSTVLEAKRATEVDRIIITWSKPRPDLAGRELSDIAAEMACSRVEAVARLQPAGAVYFSMAEEDVRRVLQFPMTMVGSDGLPHDVRPHPRLWGTFPRVLGHYVRDVGLFGLPEALRRMTSLPAARFGLTGRGVLREGAFADMVLFDATRIADMADFAEPTRAAAGIRAVWVNGVEACRDGVTTGARGGRVLRNADLTAKAFS
ncbi:N-acyl-D-amino-acid deacylase family protein [Oceaniglobus indicus]|uniref:N-acyl-D-amino-acid deacylase family protein n=1 Tax=Oceaniglobus indicus TaxID=2047749 RepID=UPI000C1A86A0|nr:D-aminoacylase [Oceaniglobus indicus]